MKDFDFSREDASGNPGIKEWNDRMADAPTELTAQEKLEALEKEFPDVIQCDEMGLWRYYSDGWFYGCFNNDPINDLNTIRAIEYQLIRRGSLDAYQHFLRFNEIDRDSGEWFGPIHASASQRVDGILRTLGLLGPPRNVYNPFDETD